MSVLCLLNRITGSPLIQHDLLRAQAHQAAGIFVLCDQNTTGDLAQEDAKAIMRTLAIRRWKPASSINPLQPLPVLGAL